MSPRRAAAAVVSAKPRNRYHHGDLRRAVIDAALALLVKEGAAGLTMRAVARAAGVSQTAPYRHFSDKGALLAEVAEEGVRGLVERMRLGAAAFTDDAPRRFQALGVAYVIFACERPAHFRAAYGTQLAERAEFPSLDAAYREAFGLLHDAIVDCQRVGVVRAGDSRELALAAWSMAHGLASLLVDGQAAESGVVTKDPSELATTLTRLVFVGIGAHLSHSDSGEAESSAARKRSARV